jgi:hypothetical protein
MSQLPGTINPGQGTIALPLERMDYSKYADIRLRTLQTDPPRAIFDDGDYPCRRLYIYPVPAFQRAVELWLWEPLFSTYDLDTELSLPPGYEKALTYNLTLELAPEYGKSLDEALVSQAVESYAAIRRLNQRTDVPLRRDARLKPQTGTTAFNSRISL